MSQPEAAKRAEPGAQFLAEIGEQPAALRRLLEHGAEYARVATAGRGLVRIVGHGSSDNAASYGVYAFGLLPGLTAMRDSISLTVYYGAELDMTGSTVLALSQSGQTPDVLEYVVRARRAGAFTVAVTNEPVSELAREAEAVLPLAAGPEQAVAATKTYLNQLGALGLLAAHLAGRGDEFAGWIEEVAELLERHHGTAAEALADAQYLVPVPRPREPLLAPLLSVVPGQLFAGAVARAKGLDPDRPRGLSKVTLAR